MDDALDVLDALVSDIVRGAHKDGEKERLRTFHDLNIAALQLWDALQVLLDCTVKPIEIRSQTFARVPRQRLLEAGADVEQLTRPPDNNYYGATQLDAAKLYPCRHPDPGQCHARRYAVHHRLGPGVGRQGDLRRRQRPGASHPVPIPRLRQSLSRHKVWRL